MAAQNIGSHLNLLRLLSVVRAGKSLADIGLPPGTPINREWIDVSNFTAPFTPDQLDFVKQTGRGVCIGLQDFTLAMAFRDQCLAAGIDHDYYMDKPNRNLSGCEAGAEVYLDIEKGCLETKQETYDAGTAVTKAGLTAAIYGNKYSIQAVFGMSSELAYLKLWYANYPNDHHVPDISEFVPFNGWVAPEGWQYSSMGIAGINCDLSVLYEEPAFWTPQPPAKVIDGIGIHYQGDPVEVSTQIWP